MDETLLPSEVAEALGICQGRLMWLVENGTIPFHKKGRSIRFKKSELEAWLMDLNLIHFIVGMNDPKNGHLN